MKKLLICLMIVSLLFISGCNIIDPSLNRDGNRASESDGKGTTENDGNGTFGSDGKGTIEAVDDGMVRTVLDGGGMGAVSLPHYVSTEIGKRWLISDGFVSANVYLGHPPFRGSVAFSDFALDMSELQNCSFSIIADYNGNQRVTVMENVNYTDALYNVTTTALFDENEVYKGSVVNYSKYHNIDLDIASLVGVTYGYVNIELQIQLPDGTTSVVTSDILYYSVTDTEIVFGLVSDPVAHEGDPGIITHGWTYEKK